MPSTSSDGIADAAAVFYPRSHRTSRTTQRTGDGWAGLIEVHPAFSLAVWWLADESIEEPFPRYKSGYKSDQQSARELIVDRLGYLDIPARCAESDDCLDAWAGWRMARDFLTGDAIWAGDPHFGAYVLPAVCREVGPYLVE